MLDRDFAKLVNEEQSPGYYEVKFDGSRFVSGIYIYQLQAGDFVTSRKLLLIK